MRCIVSVNRWVRLLATIMAVMMLGACTQMIKHSNTLVFGTNTTIGLKVGRDAGQVPAVQIGFDRQEVAIVPLLANVSDDNSKKLIPCLNEDINKCHFRATSDGENNDAYSTIASFGAQSAAGGGEGEANMNVAQYFATGIAAQKLAISGGANVVAAGPGSEKIAEAAIVAAEARKAEQEAIKARAESRLDAGLIAAKATLFDTSGNVTKEKREQLVILMNDATCSNDDLDDFDGRSIDVLISHLEKRRKRCLRSLAKNLKSRGN